MLKINRKKLGSVVFGDEKKLQKLNKIVHPLVREEFDFKTEQLLEKNPNEVIVWDVPLLIEGGLHKKVDGVMVVFVEEKEQVRRLMKRNGLTKEEALKRINSAMKSNEKKKYADFLIDNNYDISYTKEQVNKIVSNLS